MNLEDRESNDSLPPALAGKASTALRKSEEEVIKKWLMAVIDDLGLKSLKSFPAKDLVSALPSFISCVAEGITDPASTQEKTSEIDEIAAVVAGLRQEGFAVSALVDDYALLKGLLLEAMAKNLRNTDRDALSLFLRLDSFFDLFFKRSLVSYVESHSAELERMANSDTLTSLFNIRFFRSQLEENLEMYRRYHVPFSLLMLDVDKLKLLNDTEGHPAGDRALVHLAEIMLSEKRTTDVAFRYGGDEFFLLMPAVGKTADAEHLALRISRRTREIHSRTQGREMTSVSIGIVTCPEDGTDAEELVSRADRALYMAKTGGRGQIARFGNGPELVNRE